MTLQKLDPDIVLESLSEAVDLFSLVHVRNGERKISKLRKVVRDQVSLIDLVYLVFRVLDVVHEDKILQECGLEGFPSCE